MSFIRKCCQRTGLTIFLLVVAWSFVVMPPTSASAKEPLLVLGDSISEGVQSFDSNVRTQPNSYGERLASQMGVVFVLPLIRSGPRGMVGDTTYRSRLRPYLSGTNLAVSGADVTSILNEQATALTVDEISTETDLVLFPRTGSQIDVAESIGSDLAVCWIGNNDVLGAVLYYDQLDASQLTSVVDFTARFGEIAQRLDGLADNVVFFNIPNVTDIGFLMNGDDLIHFLGSDYGLPEGSYTTMIEMLMIRLGIDDGSNLSDPNYVLDPSEIAQIQDRVTQFNQIIAQTAASIGAPVVDANALFSNAATNPYEFYGIPLTRRLLGGLFSLDGVHPSDISHAILANALIDVLNSNFGMSIPELTQDQMNQIFLNDPFVDKDGDGRVTGRRWAGELETLGPALGLSGDSNDALPTAAPAQTVSQQRDQVLKELLKTAGRSGESPENLTKADMASLFKGLIRF